MQGEGYHSTLALHVAQEDIPQGAIGDSSKNLLVSPPDQTRPGYGPLAPTSPTPLQHLAQHHLHESSEYELLCAPLSNGNWHQRWERMCVAQPVASSSSRMINGNSGPTRDSLEDPAEAAERFREAEMWRLAGCFRRGEVNATRSGVYILLLRWTCTSTDACL